MSLDPAILAALRTGFALLLGAAALHKLRDIQAFVAVLRGYELVPSSLIGISATLIVGFELLLVVGILLPAAAGAAGIAIAVMMLGYGAAIALSVRRGAAHDCGCGGVAGAQVVSAPLVWRNLVLAGLATLAALPPQPRRFEWLDALTITGAVAGLALLYMAIDTLLASRDRFLLHARRPSPVAG